MKIEKMLVFDPRLGVIIFFKEGFRPLHDHVRIIVALQGILLEYLLVGINFLRRGVGGLGGLWSTGATGQIERG